MRLIPIIAAVLNVFLGRAQAVSNLSSQFVFKQVSHPFMPPITSQYFFFSEDGLMWFSTAQGLTSFDGSDIVYHSSLQQANSFELNKINVMIEDKDHNFYIGTRPALLFYNRKTKQFTNIPYTFTDKQITPEIGSTALHIDNNGLLYAGSGARGLFVYDPARKNLAHFTLDPSKPDSWTDSRFNTVCSFATHATDSNKLWLGTYHGIYLFDKESKKVSQNFEIVTDITHKYVPIFDKDKQYIDIQRMDVANDSIIWFNSWSGGFAKYNTRTGKVNIEFGRDAVYKSTNLYYGHSIPEFIKLSEGVYLLGIVTGKTAIYDTRSGSVTYFNITGVNNRHEETRYLDYDRKGNIWALQRGLLYISVPENRRLGSVSVPNLTGRPYGAPKLRGVYFDTTSQMYYAAFHASIGVHRYDKNFVQQDVIPTSKINNFYNYGTSIDLGIARDGSGRFWTIGWKTHVLLPGETKFDLVENKFPRLAWLGDEDKFNNVKTTCKGNILFRQPGGLVYHIDHTTLIGDTIRCPEIRAEGVEIREPSTWYDGKRDLVYLARKEGMAQFDLGKNKMSIVPYNSLFGNLPAFQGVCTGALDATGRIWFMIPKYGIRIIDPVSLLCIDSIQYGNKGLMRGDYTTIVGGSDDYMLFRSQNGLVVYNYAREQSFLFDRSNGLANPEIISVLYSNGNVFVSHPDQFEYFRLSGLDEYSSTVRPYLNWITADTANVYARTRPKDNERTIELPHYLNSLTFSFSVSEFLFPERIEYAYQLSSLESDWHYTNYFNRKISYSNLSPGEYRFKIKAQYQGGNWNEAPVEYTIIIKPAFWQTWLFKLMIGVMLAGFFYYLYQRRIRKIRKQEAIKTEQEKKLLELEAKALRSQMNPHFIFNSLNSIKSLINKNKNDTAAEYLTIFSKLIRTLFQNSDKREVSLYEELATCKLYTQLEQMRFGDKVEFVFDVDESIDLKDIKIPALIIQPFIENAIWHGIMPKESGGMVTISVVQEDNVIQCIIDDDGIGRELSRKYKADYEATHQSKGIGLTQSRLELSKLLNEREENISILDKAGENGQAAGTKVIITLKLNNQ